MSTPLLFIGLGNPGTQYARTRHNIGIMAIDAHVHPHGTYSFHKKSGAQLATARWGDRTVYCATTTCFMNESGKQVAPLAQYLSIEPTNIYVVHDELDLPFGRIKLKKDGGEGGHNGLRSISSHLGTRSYNRLRLGIGHPGAAHLVNKFVLSNFNSSEMKDMPDFLSTAGTCITQIVENGFTAAQNLINSRV